MSQNISKYVQINDFLLLEYEFNRDGNKLDISNMGATVATTNLGTKQYFNNNKLYSLGVTNNFLELNSVPKDVNRDNWANNFNDLSYIYNDYFDTYDSNIASQYNSNSYEHDTVKVHIISGYNFDDIVGFIMQVRAEDSSSNMVDLSNFSYIKQPDIIGSGDVVKFASNTLHLGNKFYDKYVEFKIPSVYALGNDTAGGFDSSLGQVLNIKKMSDVHITYSTLPVVQQSPITQTNSFNLVETVDIQLPVTSVADNFNAFIAESNTGDYIEFFATWKDQIIGQYMGDIESGRIPLYTSNNPNDNYEEFSEIYGEQSAKWVLMHEIYVYEDLGGQSSVLSQKYTFTQDNNFNYPNYFRPILKYADIDSTFTIQYICRLTNRMDGSQIIRRASFSSTNPKKYGSELNRIRVDNIIPYKVFNRLDSEKTNTIEGAVNPITKYVKIFYNITNILYNKNNEVYTQGTGNLLLVNGDSNYKFKFEKFNESNEDRENTDLSGAYNYGLLFTLDDGTEIELGPTYSPNMNTSVGELEFKISKDKVRKLLNQDNNVFSIIIKNPDGSSYVFYEGKYYSYAKHLEQEESQNNYINKISELNKRLINLEQTNKKLSDTNEELQSKIDESKLKSPSAGEQLSIAGPPEMVTTKPDNRVKELLTRVDILEEENKSLKLDNIELKKAIPDIKSTRMPSLERIDADDFEKIMKSSSDPRLLKK